MLVVVHDLDEHVPFRELAALDGVVEVARRVVEVLGLDGLGLRLVRLRTPWRGWKWNLHRTVRPSALTSL
jgi:hypothetical protein